MNPDSSRIYDIWQFVMIIAVCAEFVLMPYSICTDVKESLYEFDSDGKITAFLNQLYYEFIIDVVHVINMLMIFVTAIKGDFGWIETWPQIALAYITHISFYFDLISTFPTLFTVYKVDYYWLYYFKILRLYNIKRVHKIIGRFVPKLVALNCTKK